MSSCSIFEILGICNGLVCLIVENKSTDIVICNPLTGEFRLIPNMDRNKRDNYFSSINGQATYFGFCMNAGRGYELFRMGFSCWRGEGLSLKGEVYSLTTDTWRQIHVEKGDFDVLGDYLQPYYNCESMSVFLHGVFYWETTDLNDYYYVLSFDVENEVFDVLLSPSDYEDDGRGLLVIKEELAMVAYQDEFTSFTISVLNEQEGIWTKKCCVENVGDNVTVLGCAGSGQLVIEVDNNKTRKLFLYDADTEEEDGEEEENEEDGEEEEDKFLPYVNHDANFKVFLYTESLVSVNVGDSVVQPGLGLSQEQEKRLT